MHPRPNQSQARLLGLTGLKQSGKDTVFTLLNHLVPGAVRLAFADPLKRELAQACGVTVEFINENKLTFRQGLQWWGTEFRRNLFGLEYWIDKTRRSLEWFGPRCPLIVITDVRFENEARLVHEQGGRIWRIIRDSQTVADPHASETETTKLQVDNHIINNGTLEQLRYCVERVYQSEFK